MQEYEAPAPPADNASRRNAVLAAAVCLAASLGFVTLGGGALVGVLFTITELPRMAPSEPGSGELVRLYAQHVEVFVMVLYGVAVGCFLAAAVFLVVGLRRLLGA
jgi:hypothetical protein